MEVRLGNAIVERVAFDRSAAGIADELLDLSPRHAETCGSAGAVDDPLFNDGPVEIVGAKSQCDLRNRWRQRHPVGFDVWKVVQHETRDGDRLQIVHAGGRRQMRVHRVLGMECQRNEAIEPAGLILEISQSKQMIDPLFQRLNVAVQHRCIRMHAHPVYSAGNFQPSRARDFVTCNQGPGSLSKNFGAAPRTAPHSRIAELLNDPIERLASNLREEVQLDHRECLEMH